MAKAILELEMPRNCKNCPLKYYLDYSERNYPWEDYACIITGKGIANKGRPSDCPLKLVEEREGCAYCTPDDNGEYLAKAFYCEKEKEHITVMFCDKHAYITIRTKDDERTASTPIYYCPMCGRRLEVEP